MPDERSDAEIGRENVPSSGPSAEPERVDPEPPSPLDKLSDEARDGAAFPPRAMAREHSEAETVIGGDYATAVPPPALSVPPALGWAPQRTIGDDAAWPSPALGNDRVPVFDSAPYVIGEDEVAPRPLTEEERAEAAAAEAERKRQRTKTLVREVVETVLLALLVFLAVRASFQNFKVEGSSMFPTLDDGEFLIVNKLVYSEVDIEKLGRFIPFLEPGEDPKRWVFHGPERGDIIVLEDPRDPGIDLIKRVIGLPGDTFEIIQGKVFINGHLLEEPYIKAPWRGSLPEVTIPPGEYFVMGDNRDNSQDSRSLGLVPKDLIIGKALLAYWPLSDFGIAPNESPSISDRTVADIFGESVPRAAATGR